MTKWPWDFTAVGVEGAARVPRRSPLLVGQKSPLELTRGSRAPHSPVAAARGQPSAGPAAHAPQS